MKLPSVSAWLVLLSLAFAICQAQDEAVPAAEAPQTQPSAPSAPQGGVRQRPDGQGGAGIGGLLTGLLGQITQTADVSECPGKCIHALASLICDEVREDVQCPSKSMRCCVEREKPNRPNRRPPPPRPPAPEEETTTNADDVTDKPEEGTESTTKVRLRKKKPTTASTTTTRVPATPESTNKMDKNGEELSLTDSSSTDPSRFYPGSTDFPRFRPQPLGVESDVTPPSSSATRSWCATASSLALFLPSLFIAAAGANIFPF